MGINKSTRPTPSSPVSNPHLILHRVRKPPSKIPYSCKTNLYTKNLKVLTNVRHRSTIRNYK